MANLARLRVGIGGAGVVGPGLMTFYGNTSSSGLVAATQTFLSTLVGLFPDDVTFTVPPGGDLINDANGALTGSWSEGGGGTVTGTQTAVFMLGTGVRVRWGTGAVVAGRRVNGTTFLVPASSGAFDTTGRVNSATVSAVLSAANTFVSTMAGGLMVWSRPTLLRTGSSHAVTSASVPSIPTSLRSRRT